MWYQVSVIWTIGSSNPILFPGVSVYPEKELLLVCDRGNKRISMWDKLGNPVDTIPLPQVIEIIIHNFIEYYFTG